MAATRLGDDQKQEIVARYREGASSTELAAAYGCSANTVSRVVKAALAPAEYEQLKQQRARGLRRPAVPLEETAATAEPEPASASAPEPAPASAPAPAPAPEPEPEPEPEPDQEPAPAPAAEDRPGSRLRAEAEGDSDDDGPGVLAIDDADDFGDDADDDSDLEDDLADGDAGSEAETFFTVPVHLGAAVEERVQCRALSEAQLPGSAYLLVDRTVELQPTPLGECPDLGPLPEQEAERQALMLFVNPRQAKRHCGRSQRVIKLPDVSLLERTAPYLLAQGISRVVIEGGIYSLPGS